MKNVILIYIELVVALFLIGFVLPFMFSEPSNELVFGGFVILSFLVLWVIYRVRQLLFKHGILVEQETPRQKS